MQRGRFYLTEKGRELLAYCQTGEPLNFTRAAIGTGRIESAEALFKLDNLVEEKQEVDIKGIKANGDGTSTISLVITNNDTKFGFLMTEVGLFARDPRVGEILYGVAYYDDYADFIPVYNQEMVEISMDIIVVVSNVETININIDRSKFYASQKDLQDLINNLSSTLDLKEYQKIKEKGKANGYASLGNDGKVPKSQLPDHEKGLQLGESETTAYRGDHGLIAYNHAMSKHASPDLYTNEQIDKMLANLKKEIIEEINSDVLEQILAYS